MASNTSAAGGLSPIPRSPLDASQKLVIRHVTLSSIAGLARQNNVRLLRAPTHENRDNVVCRRAGGREAAAAVVTGRRRVLTFRSSD